MFDTQQNIYEQLYIIGQYCADRGDTLKTDIRGNINIVLYKWSVKYSCQADVNKYLFW